MNKQTIQKTAIAYWCDEDNCFIVQSPLFDSILGAGDTISEAASDFNNILSDAYEAYLEGRMSSDRRGRPAKNRTALNTDVQSDTRDTIKKLSQEFHCSQGEVIDFLLSFFEHREDTRLAVPQKGNKATYATKPVPVPRVSETGQPALAEVLRDIQTRLDSVEQAVRTQRKTRRR